MLAMETCLHFQARVPCGNLRAESVGRSQTLRLRRKALSGRCSSVLKPDHDQSLTRKEAAIEISDESPVEDFRLSRRNGISAAAALSLLALAEPWAGSLASAHAFERPPPGFRMHVDKLDGYQFFFPDSWVEVKGTAQDCFFRSSYNLDENLVVLVSSPSSSTFEDVTDLGTVEEASQKLLQQYLTEFMSTRIGVRRDARLLKGSTRTAPDGKLYYEVQVNVKSFANNNQLAVLPEERVVQLEWDRRYVSVLGVANKRLYELRLQIPERLVVEERDTVREALRSFKVYDIDE